MEARLAQNGERLARMVERSKYASKDSMSAERVGALTASLNLGYQLLMLRPAAAPKHERADESPLVVASLARRAQPSVGGELAAWPAAAAGAPRRLAGPDPPPPSKRGKPTLLQKAAAITQPMSGFLVKRRAADVTEKTEHKRRAV